MVCYVDTINAFVDYSNDYVCCTCFQRRLEIQATSIVSSGKNVSKSGGKIKTVEIQFWSPLWKIGLDMEMCLQKQLGFQTTFEKYYFKRRLRIPSISRNQFVQTAMVSNHPYKYVISRNGKIKGKCPSCLTLATMLTIRRQTVEYAHVV